MDTNKVLNQIMTEYESFLENDPTVRELYRHIKRGGHLSQKSAYRLAEATSQELAESFLSAVMQELGPDAVITLEEALEVLPPALRENHDYVSKYVAQVQKVLDEEIGLGITPLEPQFDEARAVGLAETIADVDLNANSETFKQQMKNFTDHIVDESLRINAEARTNMGLLIRVVREYDGVGVHKRKDDCKWCLERAGAWTYEEAQEHGVWERHTGCGCTILYITERGTVERLNGLSGTWA